MTINKIREKLGFEVDKPADKTPSKPGSQPAQKSGTPSQPTQKTGTPSQPVQKSGTPYQPQKTGTPYQPQKPGTPSSQSAGKSPAGGPKTGGPPAAQAKTDEVFKF